MSVFTKRGDSGYTGLYGTDGRFPKSSVIFEVLGDFDELSSSLGMLVTEAEYHFTEISKVIMKDLFHLASYIAGVEITPEISQRYLDKVHMMEGAISNMEKELPPLKDFILPGGSEEGARIHSSRVICRKLERKLVNYILYADSRQDLNFILVYINRLSDYLFTLARMSNFKRGISDIELKN